MASPFRTVCPACGAVNRIGRDRPAAEALCGACRARLFAGKPVEVNAQDLERHLRNSDIPVLSTGARGAAAVVAWAEANFAAHSRETVT